MFLFLQQSTHSIKKRSRKTIRESLLWMRHLQEWMTKISVVCLNSVSYTHLDVYKRQRPAHAEAFMGIGEFMEIRDYCILCVVLMYLEDKEEQEQFLLSELIDYVEAQLKSYVSIDWTSFTQRKSLVRVLQYMEKLQMLLVYEGRSEAFGSEAGQEVLYENTGYSKYFATSFPTGISIFESWEDFEKTDFEE